MTASVNQRQFSRILFDTPAFVRQGNQQWPATVVDVSLHGVLLTHQAWDLDAAAPVIIDIQLDGQQFITMECSWIHSAGGRTGFRCTHIDLDSITHLRRLVELNLGDSTLLERELSHLG